MKIFLATILLIFFTSQLFSQVDLNKGLIAYYPFDGDAKDKSGRNNDPSFTKVSYTTDRFGKPNSACSFNGKDNYIRIKDNPNLHFGQKFSVTCWVMIKGFYGGTCHGNRIIMKGDADYLDGNFLLTYDDNHSSEGRNCETKYPDRSRQSFYGGNAGPVTDNYIVPEKWYQLTYTYDGTNALLYVDCNLQAKGTSKNYDFSNNYDLYLGKMNNSQYPYWFNGLLDELRFYNRTLSRAEILALCKQTSPNYDPVTCTDLTKVPAAFDHKISNCNTVSFELNKGSAELKEIRWSFGDGTFSNKKSPDHTYSKYGTYNIKVITTSKSGCKDTATKQIQVQPLAADFSFAEQGEPGEISFRVKNNKASYSWDFGDDATVSGESVATHTYQQSGNYVVKLFARNITGCTDTVQKMVKIVLPEKIIDTTNIIPVITSPVPDIPDKTLEQRNKDVIRTILTDHDSVTVSLYDNGIIDGDSITLLFNGNIILTHQLLKARPITIGLRIEPDKANDLVMYAENLGSIPPNTALLIIRDGDKRYEVNISSSKNSNGTVSFILNKRITSSQ